MSETFLILRKKAEQNMIINM